LLFLFYCTCHPARRERESDRGGKRERREHKSIVVALEEVFNGGLRVFGGLPGASRGSRG